MLPVLLDLPFIKIYTFGVFLVLAFFWSSFLLWKSVRLTSYREEEVFDGLFISLVGSLFFGRLVYVISHFNDFGFDVLKFILINGYPGLSLYGCLFGGFITFIFFSRIKKIKFAEIADYAISPLFVALAIGKLGSFFSASEVGTKTKFFLSFKYVNFDGFRHLTAFYESLLFFLAAFLSYRLLFATRRERFWSGTTFFFFIWYFSLVYLVFDPLKHSRILIAGYSVNMVISGILLIASSLYFLFHLRGKIVQKLKSITNSKQSHDKHTHSTVHNTTTNEVRNSPEGSSGTDDQAKS